MQKHDPQMQVLEEIKQLMNQRLGNHMGKDSTIEIEISPAGEESQENEDGMNADEKDKLKNMYSSLA